MGGWVPPLATCCCWPAGGVDVNRAEAQSLSAIRNVGSSSYKNLVRMRMRIRQPALLRRIHWRKYLGYLYRIRTVYVGSVVIELILVIVDATYE